MMTLELYMQDNDMSKHLYSSFTQAWGQEATRRKSRWPGRLLLTMRNRFKGVPNQWKEAPFSISKLPTVVKVKGDVSFHSGVVS